MIVRDGTIYGVVGEFKESVRKAFKLPVFTSGFEIHSDVIRRRTAAYEVLSRFPGVTQDVSLEVATEVSVAEVVNIADEILQGLDISWVRTSSVVAIYQAPEASTKTITLRVTVSNYERSLSDKEVSELLSSIASEVASRLPRSI